MLKHRQFILILFSFVFLGFFDCNAQWVKSNLPNEFVIHLKITAFAVSGNNIFVSKEEDALYLSSNNGFTWNSLFFYFDALAIKGNDLIGGLNAVYLSTDHGSNWTVLDSGYDIFNITSLAVNGNNIFAGTFYNGIWVSTNNGASFDQDSNGIKHYMVNSIVINNSNVFAGTNNGIFLSTNNGKSWTPANNGLTNKDVHSLAVSFNNVFAGTDNGVFLSTDNGSSWYPINNGITDSVINSFTSAGNYVFAGTNSGGVFLTSNYGVNWSSIPIGLTSADVTALALSSNNILAGTRIGDIWYRTLANITTGITTNKNDLPTTFKLYQNYPNPFNPTTMISYQIPNDGFVTLKIYDILGREIKTLVNDFKSQGKYSVNFDGSDLVSGVYFYQLRVGDFYSIKKMILMK